MLAVLLFGFVFEWFCFVYWLSMVCDLGVVVDLGFSCASLLMGSGC